MPISKQDHQRIADAIHAAEANTSGEIVCVLARASGDYDAIPLVWAAMFALALPWALVAFTQWAVLHILLAQIVLFAVLFLLFSIPAIGIKFVPRAVQRAQAHRSATEQFMVRGISRTRGQTGVLIFVSMAEKYARVIADDGIAAKIPQPEWQAMVDALVEHCRTGRTADGFVAAVATCGALLHAHFPARPDDVNELPDRLYVI